MAPEGNDGKKIVSVDNRPLREIGNAYGFSVDKNSLRELGLLDENDEIPEDIEERQARQIITDDGEIRMELPVAGD